MLAEAVGSADTTWTAGIGGGTPAGWPAGIGAAGGRMARAQQWEAGTGGRVGRPGRGMATQAAELGIRSPEQPKGPHQPAWVGRARLASAPSAKPWVRRCATPSGTGIGTGVAARRRKLAIGIVTGTATWKRATERWMPR